MIKEDGYADKEIICDDNSIKRIYYEGSFIYLIPKDKVCSFRIKALKARHI